MLRVKKVYRILLTIFIKTIPYFVCAQSAPQVLAPLPEASALFKSTDIPVSAYSGLPDIQIPLYTVQLKELAIPIGLTYNARGILVSETASRVGMGWALKYGGMISRQIRGTPDDESHGILRNDYYNIVFTDRAARGRLHSAIVNDNADQVPDQFYYDVNGKGGKFTIDHNDGNILLQKFDDLRIEPNTTPGKIASWIVTDKWGNKFYYGRSRDGSREANDYSFLSQNYFFGHLTGLKQLSKNENRWITSWHLMEIQTYLNEKIEFFYEVEDGIQYRRISDELSGSGEDVKEMRSYFSYNHDRQYQVSEIRFPGGNIMFQKEMISKRKDYRNTHSLKSVIVKDNLQNIVRQYEFNYFYQRSKDDDNQLSYLKTVDTSSNYRLFLSSIKQINQFGDSLPSHKFDYSSILLPNRFSNSQDNWGYFNGKGNGSFLSFYDYGTAINREVDTALSGAGLLKRITYPTGGYSNFVYEQNCIAPLPFIDKLLISRNNPSSIAVKGAGLYFDSSFYEDGIYSKIITVGEDLVKNSQVTFSFVPPFIPPGADSSVKYYQVKLNSKTGDTSLYLYPPHTERKLDLKPGSYKLMVIPTHANDPDNSYRGFIAGLHWTVLNENADSLNVGEWYGAGKRIKKIDYGIKDSLASVREFEYLKDSLQTSGVMIGLPSYLWIDEIIQGIPVVRGYGAIPGSPLSQVQGNSLGYSKVTEYRGTKTRNSGKTVYEFTVDPDGGEYYKMPYHLPVDFEWLRGMPLSTKFYRNSEGVYELQKEIKNTYIYGGGYPSANIFSRPILHMDSVYVYEKDRNMYYVPLFTFTPCETFTLDFLCYKIYYQSGGRVDIASTIETNYESGQPLTTTTEYGYNFEQHYQQIAQTTLTSKGNTIINTTIYPPDLIAPTAPEQKLIASSRIAIPVKTEAIRYNRSGLQLSKMTNSIINKNWAIGNLVLPEAFNSSVDNHPLEIESTIGHYNHFGSPLEITSRSGIKKTYVWGYQSQYPVAEVTGSDYNTVVSFIDTSVVQNAFRYTDEQVRTELDKIRSGLANTNAQVITYTYQSPGISSITNELNQTVHYEYDDFGRLTLIKDHENKILKRICYDYAGQEADCSGACFPNWQGSSNYRCVKDSNGHNMGFQERQETDAQVCSKTYGKTRWVPVGYNVSSCPLYVPCSHGSCESQGPEYKCVNGECEMGYKIFTSSYYNTSLGRWVCTYHYEWSDGSWSQNYTQINPEFFKCNIG